MIHLKKRVTLVVKRIQSDVIFYAIFSSGAGAGAALFIAAPAPAPRLKKMRHHTNFGTDTGTASLIELNEFSYLKMYEGTHISP